MLSLTLSNRFEFLLENLLARLKAESPPAFTAQQVIVPSTALRRRLELALADKLGLCADVNFAFLAQWLWDRMAQVVTVREESPFAPAQLAWRIYEIFGDAEFLAPHARLGRYLENADAVMRFELAHKTAQLMDHYVTYRPEWLAQWDEGNSIVGARHGLPADLAPDQRQDEAWQAALWRRLTLELGTDRQHPSVAFFREVEQRGLSAGHGLPATAHVFCLPTLPPLYLDILRRLSHWMDVRLYVLNPCEEHWFEIVDPKRLSWLAARHGQRQTFHEVGNSLLATWGKQAQAHLDLLFSDEGQINEDGSLFIAHEPEPPSLLQHIQDAVLTMTDPEPGSWTLAEDDRSLEIHVCHSLTRQLEVLQDRLLQLFATSPDLGPQDVLVVLPDLESAAPLIDSVFAGVPPERRLPYTITGRGQTRINAVARLLTEVLALLGSRFTAGDLFALMQQPPLAARYDFDSAALERIRNWLEQAGIRWGLDGAQRRALGLPDDERFTFSDGLHRLFLAYALGDGAEDTVIAGRLPAGNPEGSDAQILGRFWQVLEVLSRLQRDWRRPKTAENWRSTLMAALNDLVPEKQHDWVDELRAVHAAIGRLCDNIKSGGAHSELPLELIRTALIDLLDDPARGGVPTGAVTFSSMSSLRNLPYAFIALLGLEDGAFPGHSPPLEFDLMALAPRRGDRQRRQDERNLFLDLLLAARRQVHLSYTGRGVRDNAVLPPSVLVAELLDYALAGLSPVGGDTSALRKQLLLEHPLQAFSSDYFRSGPDHDGRLLSYNQEYCQALQAAAATSALAEAGPDGEDDEESADAQARFFPQALTAPPPEAQQVSLAELTAFFRNPCRALLRARLDLALREQDEALQDDEPFLPDFPGRQALAQRLLPHLISDQGKSAEALFALARAGHEYPTGHLGDAWLSGELDLMRNFADRLSPDLIPPLLAPQPLALDLDLAGEAWQFSAGLADVRPGGLVRWRYDDTRPSDYLSAWLDHLLLCAAAPAGAEHITTWHSRDGSFRLLPCGDARAELAKLLSYYREGLSRPLHFFPKSSWALALAAHSGKGESQVHGRWHNSRNPAWGESADPSYQLALRGLANPLDDAFRQLSLAIYQPLLACLEDQRLE